MDFYEKLYSRRRSWVPVCGEKQPVKLGAESTIGKCLALRTLEIPVGEWVESEIYNDKIHQRIPESALRLLAANIQDETKHDLVLNMAASKYKLTSPKDESEATLISERWLGHPDHPITKAAVLESSVFFVILPILRFLGSPGLRTIANDISNDESIHAPTNRSISKLLGYDWSPSLDELRRDTVDWIVDSLEGESKWSNPEIWLNSSDSLMMNGTAPLLTETKRVRMLSPYEMANDTIPVYG